MSISSLLENEIKNNTYACSICNKFSNLDKDDRDMLNFVLRERSVSIEAIRRILMESGIKVSSTSLRRHRDEGHCNE